MLPGPPIPLQRWLSGFGAPQVDSAVRAVATRTVKAKATTWCTGESEKERVFKADAHM